MTLHHTPTSAVSPWRASYLPRGPGYPRHLLRDTLSLAAACLACLAVLALAVAAAWLVP